MRSELQAEILDRIGQVPPDYAHHQRVVRSGDPLVLERAVLKWYEVYRVGEEPGRDLDAAARDAALALASGDAFPLQHGFGFVVVHHSTANDYVIVCSWFQVQELWHAILVRTADGSAGFRQEWPSRTSGSFCVWEMAPMWHERNAWERYLWSARDIEARRAYLEDQLTGPT